MPVGEKEGHIHLIRQPEIREAQQSQTAQPVQALRNFLQTYLLLFLKRQEEENPVIGTGVISWGWGWGGV